MEQLFYKMSLPIPSTVQSGGRNNIKKLIELLERAEYAKNMRYDIDFTQNFFKAVRNHID